MSANGPRIFVMPATDPINPNVHPVIYRWNAILGQSQAAALEAAGKDGIIYNSTYTNFWQGAMAWSGWWHNQIGLLTEVASARIAAPVDQQRATGREHRADGTHEPRRPGHRVHAVAARRRRPTPTPRTEYPRPWMGGRWTLRDIVDYELIATMALLETAADRRETILRQIYEVNRQTVEEGRTGQSEGDPRAGRPAARSARGGASRRTADARRRRGVSRRRAVRRSTDDSYAAGTFVIPMTQVFARYAKDLLEKQTYPEVRREPERRRSSRRTTSRPGRSACCSASTSTSSTTPLPAVQHDARERRSRGRPAASSGNGPRFVFEYDGPDTAIAINRLLKDGARLSFDAPSRVAVDGVDARQARTRSRASSG